MAPERDSRGRRMGMGGTCDCGREILHGMSQCDECSDAAGRRALELLTPAEREMLDAGNRAALAEERAQPQDEQG